MDNIGKFELEKIPKSRKIILTHLEVATERHYMRGLIEVDVTTGKQLIKDNEKSTGKKMSFTAWLLSCIGKAVNEHKDVHAVMKGKKEVVKFDEVDISIMVEKMVKGKKVPMPLIIRDTQEKSVEIITNEIRSAQEDDIDRASVLGDEKSDRLTKLYQYIPKFIVKWYYKRIIRNPFSLKKYMGTVLLTSVGMFGNVTGWPLISTVHPLAIAVGGITDKPRLIDGDLKNRKFLTMTIAMDHKVVDGAPAARFINRLSQLIEQGFGLQEDQ